MKTKEGLCKKIILSIFFLLVLCRTAGAQDARKGILSAADAGTCTANSTACSFLTIPSGSGGVTFTITANASANTIQFEATGDTEPAGSHTWVALNVFPSNSTVAVSSTTSTGTWQANIAGFTQVRLRMSTFVGGTTTTYINLSTASARAGGGGGLPTGCTSPGTGAITCTGTVAANALTSTTSVITGSGAAVCGAATSCFGGVEAATPCTPTVGQICIRPDSTNNNFMETLNGGAETPLPAFSATPAGSKCLHTSGVAGLIAEAASDCAAAPSFPVTVGGTVTSGGIPYFNSTVQESSSALLAANALVVGGGAGAAPKTGNADCTYVTHTLACGAAGIVDLSAVATTNGFRIPNQPNGTISAGADGSIGVNSNIGSLEYIGNGGAWYPAAAGPSTSFGTTCTNQVITAIAANNGPTCTTITSAYADSSLAKTAAYVTATNCSSSASPAVCASAPAGSVVIAAGATTVQVNTTAVTANSQILVFPDETLGTKLSVTCNSTLATAASGLAVTARTAATSFTISTVATIAVNPVCLSYFIVN